MTTTTNSEEAPLNITPDTSVAPLFPDSPQGLSDELAATKAQLAKVEEELAECQKDYEKLDLAYDELDEEYTAYVEGRDVPDDEDDYDNADDEEGNEDEEEPSTSHQVELLQKILAELSALGNRGPLEVKMVEEKPSIGLWLFSVVIFILVNWYYNIHLHLSDQALLQTWGTIAAMIYFLKSFR